jgi:hypothetical protein
LLKWQTLAVDLNKPYGKIIGITNKRISSSAAFSNGTIIAALLGSDR